jgi:hypothetical protein
MSAFSFPGDSVEPESPPSPADHPAVRPKPSAPGHAAPAAPAPAAPANLDTTMPSELGVHAPPPRRPPPRRPVPSNAGAEDGASEWRAVYEEFVATKQQCGENVDGFTYEKFEQTLKKNRDALVKRHGAAKVKFSVYVKDGKAALKASPIKE